MQKRRNSYFLLNDFLECSSSRPPIECTSCIGSSTPCASSIVGLGEEGNAGTGETTISACGNDMLGPELEESVPEADFKSN
jgi:hypothetical protein